MSDLSSILKLLEKLVALEQLAEIKIKQVKDVKKRKAIRKAFEKRDRDALNRLFLIISSCTHYDPTLYPGYDVLNPNAEVRLNPLGFTEDGNAIVNEAFMLWVYELKEEIKRLRKLVK